MFHQTFYMGAYLAWPPDNPTTFLSFDVVLNEQPEFATQITEHVVEQGANISDNVRVALARLNLEVFVTNEPIDEDSQWSSGSVGSFGAVTVPAPNQPPQPLSVSITAPEWISLPIGIPLVGSLLGSLINPGSTTVSAPLGIQPTSAFSVNPVVLQFSGQFDAVANTSALLETLRQTTQLLNVLGSRAVYPTMVLESWGMTRNSETGTGAVFSISLKEIRQVTTQTVAVTAVASSNQQSSLGKQPTQPASSGQVTSLLAQLDDSLFPGMSVPAPTP